MLLRRRPVVLTLLPAAALVGTALVPPGAARADVPPAPSTAVSLAPGGIPPTQQESDGYDFTAHGEALATVSTRPVAPGLDLTSYQRLESGGWNRGTVLTADLTEKTLAMDVRDSGKVAGVAPVTQQMQDTGAVAGINGDFFDINASGAPVGIAKSRTGIANTVTGTRPAFQLVGGRAVVGALTSSGTLTTPDGSAHPLAGFNTPHLPTDGIGVYSALWGDTTLDYAVGTPGSVPEPVARATVVGGVVTAVGSGAGAPAVTEGGQVLLGRDAGAAVVGALQVGQHVDVEVGLSEDVDLALSGADQLVTDGAVASGISDDGLHARTAIGVDRSGTRVIALTVDGLTTASVGMKRTDLAVLMQSLGAWEAINLDGGGSSTMVARIAGTTTPVEVNTPQDGTERPVSNSLLFFSSAQPQGRPVSAQSRPVSTRAGAYTVLTGLHRTVFGSGVDAAYAAAEHDGRFTATNGRLTVTRGRGDEAVATGRRTGPSGVTFDAGRGRTATAPLTVLGPLDHLAVDRATIPFTGRDGSAPVRLTGYDADGRPSPVEPQDVRVEAEPGVVVTPDGADGFTITPATAKGTALVRFQVGDHWAETQVLVGLDDETVAGFADGASWTAASDRATGTVTTTTGPSGEPGLRLQYDFTRSTATRGMYAVPPAPITVSGQPLELSMWVKGDGSGAWPRIMVASGDGTVSNLDGPLVTWTGWQQVTFPVPAGTAMPLTVSRIRFLEVRADTQYQGDVSVADLVAHVSPPGTGVTTQPVHDPVVLTDGTVADRPLRVAVLSDGQFVARDPDGELLQSVRERLREIVAAKPDYLVIDGDLVDEASPADLALAEQVLDEEVADRVPWTYVPGNHEVMGGPITNFEAVFGPAHTTRLLSAPGGGTRLITLNTSSLTLHGNDDGKQQLVDLEAQLQQAATDPDTTGVLVAMHVPMDDPLADKASQLTDRLEAQQLQDRLGRFRAQTGKSVAVVNGHVGVFDGSSAQGVSVVVNGNSGKTPAGNADHGGFRGWTMLGIDPARGIVGRAPEPGDRTAWLQAETHPAVDSLQLAVPATLGRGSVVTLSPTLTQSGVVVPVAWPVSAQWSGTGVAFDEHGSAVVRYDAATGRLTALRAGTATLVLTVNGVTTSATVTVT
ncbi:phosphodiester glycosidase family protein [Lapillicoccus jejuensis]|uniref:phosphodiester glycosidase family protein n=1 Tax=Lapillicoccus jejuensis TaxID=402171 RepID=UPI0014768B46|nr:phosphodiester glycosidase family protein [Lapillicoccus jejuensis]